MYMSVKLFRMGIYNEEFVSIKSPIPLITWSSRSRKMFYLLYHYYHKTYSP